MFFVLGKIFWAVFTPLTFISLLICGGFLLRKYVWGARVMGAGIALLFICGFFPIGHNILVYQESQYPVLTNLPKKIDGIIVLGGSVDFKKSFVWGQGQLNVNAPRITEMIALAKQYPKAKIVFTGGNGNVEKSSSSESAELNKLLKHIGFDTKRITYEDKSRNTYENMIFSKDIVKPKKGEVWLLLTSAYHMKRSDEIFNSNGWEVIPYPAGYLTRRDYRLIPNFELPENMFKLQIAVKEMIGIMAYTLTGKIKSNEVTNSSPMPAVRDAARDSGATGH